MKNLKIFTLISIVLITNLFAVNKNAVKETFTTTLDIKEIFLASPVIYSILIVLSIVAVSLWVYCLLTFREKNYISNQVIKDLKTYLLNKEYEKAINYCSCQDNLFTLILASGLNVRTHGPQFVADTMKSEGQRATTKFWQKIGLLNEIVVIAPMLGLLGTVLGMFYAFYDVNRSIDSISALFDGLGIAVGTTVAGLIVAILSMIFHSILKYKLIKLLNSVENETFALCPLINQQSSKEE